jgi:hypothetical protein
LKEIITKKIKKVETEKDTDGKKDEKTNSTRALSAEYQTDTYEYISKVKGKSL